MNRLKTVYPNIKAPPDLGLKLFLYHNYVKDPGQPNTDALDYQVLNCMYMSRH